MSNVFNVHVHQDFSVGNPQEASTSLLYDLVVTLVTLELTEASR